MSNIRTALHHLDSLEALATQTSWLSELDARAKVLVTLAFIVSVVSFDRYAVAALLPLALFPAVMASLGKLPAPTILRGVLLACPFAVMLGMFNPVFDQRVMVTVAGLGISGGWVSFASILIRFTLTVSAGLILVASTGFVPLCATLRRLGLPELFITQLLLLHRYARVLADEAARMSLARELRANGQTMALPVYGTLLGHLLLRSLQRAQRIHQAMLARGFNGQLSQRASHHWQPRDTLFTITCISGLMLARLLDLPHALGQLVLGILQ